MNDPRTVSTAAAPEPVEVKAPHQASRAAGHDAEDVMGCAKRNAS